MSSNARRAASSQRGTGNAECRDAARLLVAIEGLGDALKQHGNILLGGPCESGLMKKDESTPV